MKTMVKWIALGYFALIVMSLSARTAAAQDDAQPGFDDPTAMAAPPAQFIAPADIKMSAKYPRAIHLTIVFMATSLVSVWPVDICLLPRFAAP